MVPRPPTRRRPNRANGAEQVVILGVTLRITITEDGSEGMSLEAITSLCTDRNSKEGSYCADSIER